MALDPNIILSGNRPAPIEGPIDQYAKAIQLKSLLQAQQQDAALAPGRQQLQSQAITAGQQEQQVRTQQIKDQEAQTAAMQEWDGKDPNHLPTLILKHGGSSNAVMATGKQIIEQQKAKSEMAKADSETGKNNFETAQKKNDALLGHLSTLNDVPDEQLHDATLGKIQEAVQNGLLDPQHGQQMAQNIGGIQDPTQLRNQLKVVEKGLMGEKAQFDQAQQERKTAAEEQRAEAAKKNVTESELALRAAGGDAQAEAALKRLDQSKREGRPVTNLVSNNDVKDIADAIENGDQPPTLQGLYKNGAPVRAELARRGVPIARMETDWKATQKYLSTLNGPQQTRLRQDISTVSDSLDKVEGLYGEWQKLAPTSGFKVLNKASLAAMKQLPGRAGAVAQALEAQIADTTAGLGTIYMGGNSPTDHSLSLAAHSLSSDWNEDTFKEALKQARANVKIRENSITHAQPAGVSSENTYAPPPPAATSGGNIPAGAKTATGPQGHKIYVQDGKWIDSVTGKPL